MVEVGDDVFFDADDKMASSASAASLSPRSSSGTPRGEQGPSAFVTACRLVHSLDFSNKT